MLTVNFVRTIVCRLPVGRDHHHRLRPARPQLLRSFEDLTAHAPQVLTDRGFTIPGEVSDGEEGGEGERGCVCVCVCVCV